MKIRTDLQDTGVYIFKYWIIKLLEGLENEYELNMQSLEVNFVY